MGLMDDYLNLENTAPSNDGDEISTVKKEGSLMDQYLASDQQTSGYDPYEENVGTPFGMDIDPYTKYLGEGVTPGQFGSTEELNRRRAEAQPWGEQAIGMLNQGIIGNVVGGTLEGIGYLADLEQYANLAKGSETEFGNWFSDIGKGMKTWAEETTPIYQTEQGSVNPGDSGWWFSMGKDVFTTLSLMIPASGAIKGASMLGKALGITQQLGKAGKAVGMSAKAMNFANWASTGVGQAVVSRHMENMMEASQTHESSKKELTNALTKEYQSQIEDEIVQIPIPLPDPETGMTDNSQYEVQIQAVTNKWKDKIEKEANIGASEGAASVYRRNWANLAMDIPQYLIAGKALKGGKPVKLSSKIEGIATKAGKESADLMNLKASKAAKWMVGVGGEGVEEGGQYIVQQEGGRIARLSAGLEVADEGTLERIDDYRKEGDFWNSVIGGMFGGAVFQGLQPIVQKHIMGVRTQEEMAADELKNLYASTKIASEVMEQAELRNDKTAMRDIANQRIVDGAVKAAVTSSEEGDITNRSIEHLTDWIVAEMGEDVKGKEEVVKDITETFSEVKTDYERLKEELAPKFTAKGLDKILPMYASQIAGNNRKVKLANKELAEVNSRLKEAEDIPFSEGFNKSPYSTMEYINRTAKNSIEEAIKGQKAYLAHPNITSEGKKEVVENIKKYEEELKGLSESYKKLSEDDDRTSTQKKSATKEIDTKLNSIHNTLQSRKRVLENTKKKLSEQIAKDSNPNSVKTNEEELAKRREKKVKKDSEKATTAEEIKDLEKNAESQEELNIIDKEKGKKGDEAGKKSIEKNGKELPIKENGSKIEKEVEYLKKLDNFLEDRYKDDTDQSMLSNELKTFNDKFGNIESLEDLRVLMHNANTVVGKEVNNVFKQLNDRLTQLSDEDKPANNTEESIPTNNDSITEEVSTDIEPINSGPIHTNYYQFDGGSIKGKDYKDDEDLKANPLINQFIGAIKDGKLSKDKDDIKNAVDYLNSSEGLKIGDELELVVDTEGSHNKNYETTGKIYLVAENNIVISILPSTTQAGETAYRTKEVRKLVAEIVKGKSGIVRTGITTKVSRKYPGLWTRNKNFIGIDTLLKDTDINPTFSFVKTIATQGVRERVLPNSSLHIEDSKNINENIKNFSVFLALPLSNGKLYSAKVWIQALLPKNNPKDLIEGVVVEEGKDTEWLDKAESIINKLPADVGSNEIKKAEKDRIIKEELDPLVYFRKIKVNTVEILNEGVQDKLELIGRDELGRDVVSATFYRDFESSGPYEGLREYLANMLVKVDFKKLNDPTKDKNGKTYNDKIIESGRVKVNLKPASNYAYPTFTNSSGFDVDGFYSKKEDVQQKEKFIETEQKVSGEQKEGLSVAEIEKASDSLADKLKAKTTPLGVTPVKGISRKGNKIVDQNDAPNNPEKNRAVVEGETINVWNEKQEIAWFKKRFPKIPIEVLDNIIEIKNGGGKKAWGVFNGVAVEIYKYGKAGTAYHEAFHVAFNLFFTDNQRKQLLEKFDEETLAEKFADGMLQEKYPTTLIGRLLNNLYQFIKSLVTKKIGVEDAFFRIANGYYKYSKLNSLSKSFVDKFSTKEEESAVPGMSKREVAARAINVASLFSSRVTSLQRGDMSKKYYADNPKVLELKGKDRRDCIIGYGVDQIYTDIYYDFYDKYETALRDDDKPLANKLVNTMNNLIIEDNNGNVSFGIIGNISQKQLWKREGILLDVLKYTQEVDDETLNKMLDDAETTAEYWSIVRTRISSKLSMTPEFRQRMSYIPVVDYIDSEGSKIYKVDDIGYYQYLDPDETYNKLLQELGDSFYASEVYSKFEKLVETNPEYKSLSDILDKDEKFKNSFGRQFLLSKFRMNKVYNRADGTMSILENNKDAGKNMLIKRWQSNLSVIDDIYDDMVSPIIKGLDLTEDKDKAEFGRRGQKVLDDYLDLRSRLSGYKLTEEQIEEFLTMTNYSGIELDKDVLITANEKNQLIAVVKSDTFKKIFTVMSNGKNPIDSIDSEASLVSDLAKNVGGIYKDVFEESFVNIKGDLQYSYLLPNFILKNIHKITNKDLYKNTINAYLRTSFYKDNYILNKLIETQNKIGASPKDLNATEDNSKWRDMLKVFYLDGVTNQINKGSIASKSKRGGKVYAEMTPSELELATLSMYSYNEKSNKARYRSPIFETSPMLAFVQWEKLTNEEAVEAILSIAKQEYSRIQLVKKRAKDNTVKKVDNLDSKHGEKYHFLLFLNGKNINPFDANDNVRNLITEYLEKGFDDYVTNTLEANKIVELDKEGNIVKYKKDVPPGLKTKEALKTFYYNNYNMTHQIFMLTSGDKAQYPIDKKSGNVTETVAKRNKQAQSGGKPLNTEAVWTDKNDGQHKVNTKYETVVFKDVVINMSKNVEAINKALDKTIDFSKTSLTDAGAFRTLARHKEVMIGENKWNQKLEDAKINIEEGNWTYDDLKLFIDPDKPFYFGHNEHEGMIISNQDKNSETVLLKPLLRKDSLFYKVLEFVEQREANDLSRKVSIQFDSSTKVGGIEAVELDDYKNAYFSERLNADYIIQQETDPKYGDKEALIGSQPSLLMISDFETVDANGKDITYNVKGKEITAKEWYDDYNQYYTDSLTESFEELKSIFKDNNELQKVLIEEINKLGLSEKYVQALSLVKKSYSKEGEYDFLLPLYTPLLAKKSEQIITSLFKSRVQKQKVNGGSFVQTISFKGDITEKHDLKIEFNEDGSLKHFEARLPWWSKKYLPLGDNEKLDLKKVPEELKKIILYRIPNEDAYSTIPVKIVGFSAGVELPFEITKIMGVDFDIDKLYAMIPNFKINYKKGKVESIEKIKLSDDIESLYNKKFRKYSLALKKLNTNLAKKADKIISEQEIALDISSNILIDDILGVDRDLQLSEQEVEEILDEAGLQEKLDYKKKLEELVKEELKSEITLEDFETWGKMRQNSKQARDNYLIDLIWARTTNKTVTEKMFTPASFQNWEDVADNLNKISGESAKKLDWAKSQDMLVVFDRMMQGAKLIGPVAIANVAHAILTNTDATLKYGIKMVEFDNEDNDKLHEGKDLNSIYASDGKTRISRIIGSILAMVVDNGKNPVSSGLNLNMDTVNTAILLSAVGFRERTIGAFLRQPSFMHFTKTINDEGMSFMQIESYLEKLISSQEKFIKNYENEVGIPPTPYTYYEPRVKDMEKDIGFGVKLKKAKENGTTIPASEMVDYYKRQVNILKTYRKFKPLESSYSDLIQVLRSNKRYAGPSIAHGEDYVNSVEKVLRDKNIIGIDKIFTEESPVPMVNSYYQFATKQAIDLLSEHYPYTHTAFNNAKSDVLDSSALRKLNVDDIGHLNTNLLSFIMTNYDFFNKEVTNKLLNNEFLATFKEMKYEKFPTNQLLSKLDPTLDEVNNVRTITFENLGSLSSFQREDIERDWTALLEHNDEKVRKFGLDLVAYSFALSGANFTPKAFSHLQPVEFYSKYIPETSLGDTTMGFDKFLNDMMTKGSHTVNKYSSFSDQYMRNFYNRAGLWGNISEGNANITEMITNKEGNNLGFTINLSDGSDLITAYDEKTGGHNVVPYVRKFNEETKKYDLFRLLNNSIGLAEVLDTHAIYMRIAPYGIPNTMIEFDATQDEFTSKYGKNKLPVSQDVINKALNDEMNITGQDLTDYVEKVEDVADSKEVEIDNTPTKTTQQIVDRLNANATKTGAVGAIMIDDWNKMSKEKQDKLIECYG